MTKRHGITCNTDKLKFIQAFELALSVEALLLPPWQAVEPQTAGMVRVYDEGR